MRPSTTIVLSLPIADRRTSHAFYGPGLGFETPGALADDGVPEPLVVAVNDQTQLMLIPSDGFGWVIADREVAAPGQIECVLSISTDSNDEVDGWLAQAQTAGATVVSAAAEQPWGYTGTFADPDGHLWMVTADTRFA
ncbi:MAG: VOC family protein [Propionibacteriaceae bacterium]